MKYYTVAQIGLGKMGRVRFDAFNNNEHCRVVYFYDTNLHINNYKGAINTSWKEILNSNVDIISIAVPHVFTSSYVIDALEHGKHVFVEKPAGINREQLNEMINAKKHNDNILMWGFNHRWHDAVIKALKLQINKKQFGNLKFIRGVYGRSGFFGWRQNPKIAGHGVLLGQGIHMVDLFRLFGGEYDTVKSVITYGYWGVPEIEDNVFAVMQNNNVIASLHSSSTLWKHTFRLELGLESGYINIDGFLTSSRSFGFSEKLIYAVKDRGIRGNPIETIEYYEKDYSWDREVSEFINRINDEPENNWGTMSEAVKTMDLVFRIYENSNN